MMSDSPSNMSMKPAVDTRTATARLTPATTAKQEGVIASKPKDIPEKPELAVQEELPDRSDESRAATAQAIAEERREEVKRKVNEVIPKVRELMQKNQRTLDFKVAEEENRIIITVIDKETDKVIRQIPPEDMLHIAESIEQGLDPLKSGGILNSKA